MKRKIFYARLVVSLNLLGTIILLYNQSGQCNNHKYPTYSCSKRLILNCHFSRRIRPVHRLCRTLRVCSSLRPPRCQVSRSTFDHHPRPWTAIWIRRRQEQLERPIYQHFSRNKQLIAEEGRSLPRVRHRAAPNNSITTSAPSILSAIQT